MKYFAKSMLIIMLISVFMPGCDTVYIDNNQSLTEEELDWMYFKKGTYWIYNDTINELTDTNKVIIDTSEISRREDYLTSDRHKYSSEITLYYYIIESSYYDTTLIHLGKPVDPVNKRFNFRTYRCYGEYYYSSIRFASIILLLAPVIGNKVDTGTNLSTLTNTYDSLKVGDEYFYDVVRIHETYNEMFEGKETVVYFAKGIGIIRSQILHDTGWQTWDLYEYNIIQ